MGVYGLCPGGYMSWGVYILGVYVRRSICQGGECPKGIRPEVKCLSRGTCPGKLCPKSMFTDNMIYSIPELTLGTPYNGHPVNPASSSGHSGDHSLHGHASGW